MVEIEKATKIIDRLEGTLIADLKSIMIAAEKRDNNEDSYKCLPGGLNFSLFLLGLIAAETIGYLITNNAQCGRTDQNIRSFISCKYFKCPAYKKEKYLTILVSLRTNLAHVFGMTEFKLNFVSEELQLCVGGHNKSELLNIKGIVNLNGIKFVKCVIDAFEKIKFDIQKDGQNSKLASTICQQTQLP